ncbi:hypothetical protein [Methanoculleus chikugoensis]|uniref:Uncharacterized protein n=1 Tax=Methanoculleus chikugoensis TaxID=118126 RepID=A0ABM7H2F7_9EURY|nr:hypothetical protein [Methanoculleus chikugoensis]BBL66892.1 hypothetical protein MchiMG62_00730 [Methanoculleus chikugoensis]
MVDEGTCVGRPNQLRRIVFTSDYRIFVSVLYQWMHPHLNLRRRGDPVSIEGNDRETE